jgi:hypothetical protein
MSRKTPKCSKGFPCGKTCISRSRLCWANLSSSDSKMAETFSQFVNRIVGIGNDNQSEIINNAIESETKIINVLEKKVLPKIKAGRDVTNILNQLNNEISAGTEATKLLEELKPIEEVRKAISVEVMPDEGITQIPKLLNPGSNVTIDIKAETIKDEINAGNRVKSILEELKPNEDKIEEVINQEIIAGKEATKLLNNLKPIIAAGGGVTEILNKLKEPIEAGKEVTKILEELKPPILAGEEVKVLLDKLEPPVNAGKGVTEILNNLKAPIEAGKEVSKILGELKPKVETLDRVINNNSNDASTITNTNDASQDKVAKYIKSHSELTKDEIKQIKANKGNIDELYNILLSDGGKLEKEYLDKEEAELEPLNIEANRKYAAAYHKAYYQDKFVPEVVGFSASDYDRVLQPFSGNKIEDLINLKVKPLKSLLERNIRLADEYRKLDKNDPRRKELTDLFKKNQNEIKELLEASSDYEDETYNDVSLHDQIFKIAFKDFPRGFKNEGKVYEQSLYDIASDLDGSDSDREYIIRMAKGEGLSEDDPIVQQRLRNRSKNADRWLKIDISDDDAKKLDERKAEINKELSAISDPKLAERERNYKERKEEFVRELDRQVSSNNSEDKARYNREGNVSPNIAGRNLPNGDSNNPEEAKLQEIINNRAPMMAIPVAGLKGLLDGDGEFKNVYDFENQKKGIAGKLTKQEFELYKEARKKKEYEALGVPLDAKPSERPIYGFLGNQEDLAFQLNYDGIQAYGDIVIQFKPEVKDDITVTVDDSLGGPSPNQKGSPANKISKESMPNRQKANVNLDAKDHRDIVGEGSQGVYREPRYIEWQGGGRLNISNVEKVHIPLNVYYSLPAKVLKQLESNGIEVVLLAPRSL